jgi:hypothetical protein
MRRRSCWRGEDERVGEASRCRSGRERQRRCAEVSEDAGEPRAVLALVKSHTVCFWSGESPSARAL